MLRVGEVKYLGVAILVEGVMVLGPLSFIRGLGRLVGSECGCRWSVCGGGFNPDSGWWFL